MTILVDCTAKGKPHVTFSRGLRVWRSFQGAHRKVLDILNLLGVSNNLMKSAERRDSVDRWIVLGGMIVVLIVLYLCYRWVRG
jgi:hypothetical protein